VAAALEGALATAARRTGVWPETVRVRHQTVADALRPLLEARDVQVAATETLPELEEAARSMMEHMLDHAYWPPVCRATRWVGWGLSASRVSEVFRAAADYWRAAPWRYAANLQAPRLTTPAGREWTAVVLGKAGEEFGLALYSDPGDLFDRLDQSPESPFGGVRGQIIALTFDRPADLPPAARQEARMLRRELAGPDAFPTLTTVNTPGGGVTNEDMADLILALGAVPAFVAEYRQPLEREEQTGIPCRLIEWTHEPTGARFAYDGEAVRTEEDIEDEDDEAFADQRRMIQDAIAAALDDVGDDAEESVIEAAVNRRVARATDRLNNAPQADFGGLSPVQVQRLIQRSDWLAGDGAIRLRTDLTLAELDGAPTFANARTLLSLAVERGGLPATTAGNLKMVVVEELLDRLRFEEGFVDSLRRDSKRITEQDVWPLHEPRVLLDVGGLMHLAGTRFKLTEQARRLVDDGHAGDLFARLFQACFVRFNLAYGGTLEWPELQHQIGYTLFRLGLVARDWIRPDELVEQTVLPLARERAPRLAALDAPAWVLRTNVLDRLVDFGLVERRSTPSRRSGMGQVSYRVTRLHDALLAFDV
jgi:hypothetical protein